MAKIELHPITNFAVSPFADTIMVNAIASLMKEEIVY